MTRSVFITGGTGYLGRRIIRLLLNSGYDVKALIRSGSEYKLPQGTHPVVGDPFNGNTFASSIDPGRIFIQLLGVSRPGPSKKDLFYKIDYTSAEASVVAATAARCSHFIYVSVAQTPTSVMKDYQECRAKCEKLINDSLLISSIIRPWYIIGPGHYWPLLFLPLFKILELVPNTSVKAKALRIVYLRQMLATLLFAVGHPPEHRRVYEIEEIRKMKT